MANLKNFPVVETFKTNHGSKNLLQQINDQVQKPNAKEEFVDLDGIPDEVYQNFEEILKEKRKNPTIGGVHASARMVDYS